MQSYVNTIDLKDSIRELLDNLFLLQVLREHCTEKDIKISTFVDQRPIWETREFPFIIHKSSIKETKEFYSILAQEIITNIQGSGINLKTSYKISAEHLDKYIILTIDNKFSS